ncbi:MAG TPA: serine/threonine-protein kinase, partial [Polyangiaceae bacterium]
TLWDQHEAVRAAANRELHPHLLKLSSERLRATYAASTIALAAYLVAVFALSPTSTALATAWRATLPPLAVAIGLSLVMVLFSRIPKVRDEIAYEAGYVFLFALSLLLGLFRHIGSSDPASLARQLSPVALPVLAFGALIPATPKRALIAYVGAAAMDPLALVMARPHAAGLVAEAALAFTSPLVAALVAFGISRVAHRLSEGIVKAREVGSYRLVERLGVGGMAEVWRAEHRMLARPAAVKLIRPAVLNEHGPVDTQRLLRLFLREARATASLSSPHTISVYDFGITREGAFYYVMELLDGIDLQSLVTRFGAQPSERSAHFLAEACESLTEAHEKDFVHRDVKPANLFTCRLGGNFDFVKVLDFGLVLDGHPTPEELEDEKRFVGTPAVMAPEMVRFQAPVDRRADIYALGCVGYFLLTGKRVFEAETRHDMLVMHAHQKPILPSKRVELAIHSGLEALVMSCLEKNPNRRPQTARELRESLLALAFERPWSEERARLWWKTNLEKVETAPPDRG